MNSIQVTLPCECGGNVTAAAGDAGGSIFCRCGRSVAVPNLSRLRVLCGRDAYVTNPVEAIRKMQRTGKSPAGTRCLLCGGFSPTRYEASAVCETSHVKSSAENNPKGVLAWLGFVLMAWFTGFASLDVSEPGESDVRGHDVSVDFELPVCDACANTNGSPTRKSVAVDLMRRVPEYRSLLEAYPELVLTVKRAAT